MIFCCDKKNKDLLLQEGAKKKMSRELINVILARKPKMSAFLEWQDYKIVYKRYASLYFCCAIEVITYLSDREALHTRFEVKFIRLSSH